MPSNISSRRRLRLNRISGNIPPFKPKPNTGFLIARAVLRHSSEDLAQDKPVAAKLLEAIQRELITSRMLERITRISGLGLSVEGSTRCAVCLVTLAPGDSRLRCLVRRWISLAKICAGLNRV